ncbi:hypothetical protein GCM10009104_13350 [Marinobacterium maritimum]|uniref:Uncharacterized protein n=1 Tax=Marinobacterium maritimum TaxID=500162 RepID=A0ABN1I4T0_9GAMM
MNTQVLTNTIEQPKAETSRNLATLCLLVTSSCAIARELSSPPWLSFLAGGALLCFFLLQWQRIARAYRLFAIVVFSLAAGLWFSGRLDTPVLVAGLDRAAFFTLFLTSLAVIRESASSSSLVHRCGRVLVHQPPGRRYLLMSFGSHLFSVMLNIGALNVLGTMVQRAIRPINDPESRRIGAIRNKRMLLGVMRGFCGVPLWAPTSVTMLLVLSGIPDLSWEQYAPLGLLWTLLFVLLGALLDRLAYPKPQATVNNPGGLSELTPLLPLIALVALIPSLAYLLARLSGLRLFSSLLMCAPLIGLMWIWVQYRSKAFNIRTRLLLRRLQRSFPETFTNQRNEVALFSSSGLIGVILIPMVDPTTTSELLARADIGNAALMIGLSMSMIAFSFIGINAIITVTLFLGTLQQLPDLTISPLVQASVISITWAVFAGVSPFTASLRLISQFSPVSPIRFGLQWNSFFSVSVLAIMYTVLCLVL